MAYPGIRSHTWSALEEILAANLNGWAPNNVAWGLAAAPATSTSDQTGITTAFTDITFATLSWTSVNGRWYEISLSVMLLQVTTAGVQYLEIQTGASGAGTKLAGISSGNTVQTGGLGYGIGNLTAFLQGDGTTKTAHARVQTSAGTVSVKNATQTGLFLVKDIGLNAP